MAIEDYDTVPANNNATPPNGAPEGMAASTVNNTIRQIMADLAVFLEEDGFIPTDYVGTFVSSGTFSVTGDLTTRFTAKRRISVDDLDGQGVRYAHIVSSAFGAGVTTVNLQFDSGNLTQGIPSGNILLGPNPVILDRLLDVFNVDSSVNSTSGDLINNGLQYRRSLVMNNSFNTGGAQGAGVAVEFTNWAVGTLQRSGYIGCYDGAFHFIPGNVGFSTQLDTMIVTHDGSFGQVVPGVTSASDLGTNSNPWRNLYVVNSPVVTSDPRKKDNIEGISDSVREQLFQDVSGIQYTRIGGAATKYGFNAKQVQDALIAAGAEERWEEKEDESEADRKARRDARKRTGLVQQADDDDQSLAMAYESMIAMLWDEVKALRARVGVAEKILHIGS